METEIKQKEKLICPKCKDEMNIIFEGEIGCGKTYWLSKVANLLEKEGMVRDKDFVADFKDCMDGKERLLIKDSNKFAKLKENNN
jgi:hypothetical protein